jgi:signal transduction histidine kinase
MPNDPPPSHELRAVQNISEALFQTRDLDDLLERALRTALAEVGAESGSILLADPETSQLVFRSSIGESPVPRGTAIDNNRGIAGSVYHSGTAMMLADVKQSPLHNAAIDATTGHPTRNMICVPLRRFGGETIGVVNVLNKKSGAPGENDLSLLSIISAFTAIAIEQGRHFEEAKLAEIARTVGNIGHDLKNLLTPVVSCTGLLREELEEIFVNVSDTEAKERCFEALGLIERTSLRIHHRVKEIADSVKGRTTAPLFAPCTLSGIVRDVFATAQVLAADKQIRLLAENLEDIPALVADERRLYSALYNLVMNALAEVSTGGEIRIFAKIETPQLSIFVKDDGRGMRPETRDSLFSGRAASSKKGGTGLGTKIVSDVVKDHGGTISVESEPGKGALFHLRILLDSSAKEASS